jgi:hypothetical protein
MYLFEPKMGCAMFLQTHLVALTPDSGFNGMREAS